jgi:low affinity Fe/Cu permease
VRGSNLKARFLLTLANFNYDAMKMVTIKKNSVGGIALFFDKLSSRITRVTGSAGAFFTALAIIIVWLVTGPMFDYSNTWQLIINTGTTVVTFLMVFIIQQSQNKDTVAIHLKLNELIACNKDASNKLVDVEHLTDQELQTLRKFYSNLSMACEKEVDLYSTHSIDEAKRNQKEKAATRKRQTSVSKNLSHSKET